MSTQPYYLLVTNGHQPLPFLLTGSKEEMICEYTGFDNPPIEDLTTDAYNLDGAIYQGFKVPPRAITLTLYFLNKRFFATNKDILLGTFGSGETVTLSYGSSTTAEKTIDAVVQTVNFPRFESPRKAHVVMQINLTAYDPYWQNVTGTSATKAFNQTFSFGLTPGTYPTPFTVTIATGTAIVNPTIHLGNDYLKLTGSFTERLVIDTAKKTITANNQNIISAWTHGSKWLKLKPSATNNITLTADNSSTRATKVAFKERYGHV